MRINHNIIGLSTLSRLKEKGKNKETALERLSSGLFINKAADDAAGLAISEKLRGQIRGLKQAQRNIQDGISLIKTAEGAIHEIQSINQRMRELCVQGANDTLTPSDRMNIQRELNSLKEEWSRISEQTEFNRIKLLDGSLQDSSGKMPLNFEWKVDFGSPKELTTMVATTDGGMIVGGTSDRGGNHHTPNDRSAYLTKLDSQGQIEWELNIPKDGEYNIVYDIKRINDSENYILSTRSSKEVSPGERENRVIYYMIDGSGNILNKVDNGYRGYSFSINQNPDGTFVETGNNGESFYVRTYDANFIPTGYQDYDAWPAHFRAGMDIKKTTDGGYIVVGQENNSSDQYGLAVKLNEDLTVAWETKIIDDGFTSVQELDNGDFMVLGMKLYRFDASGNPSVMNNEISYSIDNYLDAHAYITRTEDGHYLVSSITQYASTDNKVLKVDADGNEIWKISLSDYNFRLASLIQLSTGDYAIAGNNEVFKYTSDVKKTTGSLQIQTGPNSGQNLEINISSLNPKDLGLGNGHPSVLSRAQSNASLQKLDTATDKISSTRSHLGALQNGLEHTLNNVSNYEANLTAAESRI